MRVVRDVVGRAEPGRSDRRLLVAAERNLLERLAAAKVAGPSQSETDVVCKDNFRGNLLFNT